MTVRDVEALMRLFAYLMLLYPVTQVLQSVINRRNAQRQFDKWMHLSGPPELRRRILSQQNQIEWRDRKLAEKDAVIRSQAAIIKGGIQTTTHTLEALAGAVVLVRR